MKRVLTPGKWKRHNSCSSDGQHRRDEGNASHHLVYAVCLAGSNQSVLWVWDKKRKEGSEQFDEQKAVPSRSNILIDY